MVDSNVPHFRSLASVSCIEIILQVKIVILSSVQSNKHMMARSVVSVVRTERLQTRSFQWNPAATCINYGKIVQLQSALNHDYNNFSGKNQTRTTFQSPYWKIFSKPCACKFTLEHFHWFIQLRKETLQHFTRFSRLFRSVMWSRSILVPFYILELLSLFFSFLIL